MLISHELRAAAKKCYDMAYPFAISFMPSSEVPQFFACEKAVCPNESIECFFLIGSFGSGVSQRPLAVLPQFTAGEVLSLSHFSSVTQPDGITAKSTDRNAYRSIIHNVVSDLQGREAKVVIARQIVAETTANPLDIAEKYFTQFPECMRTIFYTPHTGMWITATPELLIDYTAATEQLRTMSLAGTRRAGEADWDLKNSREHELVTEHIVSVLKEFGMDVSVSEAENLAFGGIEHLCNRITGTGKIDPVELALHLSPTPAVGGWPVADAIKSIARYEDFDRACYGGFLGVVNARRCRLFVNLRCCQLIREKNNNYTWRLIAGGGITNMSDADAEWAETENKIGPLKHILTEKTLPLT